MRLVLDANVLISAAISEGSSHRIVQAWLQNQRFELVICDRLLGEVHRVLTERPRIRRVAEGLGLLDLRRADTQIVADLWHFWLLADIDRVRRFSLPER